MLFFFDRGQLSPTFENDPILEIPVLPPVSSFTGATFRDRIDLVQQIAEIYQNIPDDTENGQRDTAFDDRGLPKKKFLSWMHGLLCAMSTESLKELLDNHTLLEKAAGRSEAETEYHNLKRNTRAQPQNPSGASSVATEQATHVSWNPAPRRLLRCPQIRDRNFCVVSGKAGGVDLTHIVPFAINSSDGAAQFLCSLFDIPRLLFGRRFADEAKRLLGSTTSSDKSWNVVTLNGFLHGSFDKGLAAFRPIMITKEVAADNRGKEYYLVHFSIHWIPQSICYPYEHIPTPKDFTIDNMLISSQRYTDCEERLRDSYAITNVPILEGDEFSIRWGEYEEAHNMFVMLQFRWTVAVVLYLAAAVGRSEYDGDLDEEPAVYHDSGF